jgi:pimeloyl-ACP methyl ester carboxylesterase
MARPRAVDPTADIGLLTLAVAGAITGTMREQLEAAGFDDVRDSHGYVVQGLLAGDTTVTALAARLSMNGVVKAMFAPRDIPPGFFVAVSREMMLRPSQIRANAEDAAFMMPAAASLAARYSELRLPVTIMAGAADKVVDPEAHSVRLHEDVPDSELVVLPEVGHMVHYAASNAIAASLAEPASSEIGVAPQIASLVHV